MPQKPASPMAPKVNNATLEAKLAAFKTERTAPHLAAILQQLPSCLLFLAMSPSSPEAIQGAQKKPNRAKICRISLKKICTRWC